jgi:hypothetical protein
MMHELRSAIASGEALRPNGPIAKKSKAAEPKGGLTAIAVKREESRQTNQRREERHRNLLEDATLYFRRRKYLVPVVNVSSSGVMIETDIDPWIGESLEIQFGDCNRTKCIVRWIRGNRMGLEFNDETTIIGPASIQEFIIRRLRGNEDAGGGAGTAGAKPNREPRHNLIWIATLHFDHDSYPVRMRNISSEGAMLETKHQFPVGTEVLLDLEEAGTAFAKVQWAKGGQIGLKFDAKFNLKNLTKCSPTAASINAAGKPTTYMVKPKYLESEKSKSSPWAAMWDKFGLEDLKGRREF